MKTYLKPLCVAFCLFGTICSLCSQGYIVPNGVVYVGYIGSPGYEIDVMHNPNSQSGNYTGFTLQPKSATTFQFNPIVDVGVRVFLVTSNAPVSLQPILAGSYQELTYPNTYVFSNGVPFYLGFYTGNVQTPPPNGIYNDPLFGWAELENVGGAIQLLGSALEYQGGGIYAGTQTIIPVPEPSTCAIAMIGLLTGVLCGTRRVRPQR